MATSRTSGRDAHRGRELPQVVCVESGDLGGAAGADVLAVPVASAVAGEDQPQPRVGTADASTAYGVDLASVCESERFAGTPGQALAVPVAALGRTAEGLPGRLLMVGVGDGGPVALRRAGAALARATPGCLRVATTLGLDLTPAARQAFVEGVLLGAYSPPRTGVTDGPRPAVRQVELLGCTDDAAVRLARTTAQATWTVRDLSNTPSSTKTPRWLAEQAVALVAGVPGLDVQVLDVDALRSGGFGGTVAVGAGSASAPCLVQVTWTPPTPAARSRHVVLVGKGITFDTGGLSIKPRASMLPMKTDMAGAGAVLATVRACADAGVAHRVTALLPLAENAVSGAAYRPGDVVTIYGGTSVEVANTDAEGRMVLADALAYADATLDPDVLIDVATLTGAASLGLGRRHAALFSADDRLVAGLEAAASATGERLWRMPLVEEYRRAIDSDVADLRHIAGDRRVGGGAIIAALFLREFAGRRRWAHLDIAGPARSDSAEHEVTKGATGYGARLLLSWLLALR